MTVSSNEGSSEGVNEARSSSNRQARLSGALIQQHERTVGAIRLPGSRADDFVKDFNRIYRGVGLSLQPIEESPVEKKIPGGSTTAEDFDSNGQVPGSNV